MGRPPPHKRLMTGFDPPSAHHQTAHLHLKVSRRRVAQQDRALVSETRGRRIEACRDGQSER